MRINSKRKRSAGSELPRPRARLLKVSGEFISPDIARLVPSPIATFLENDKVSLPSRPGSVEIVAILKPWEEPDQSWRILSSPIPMMIRSQMSNFQLDGNVNYYIQAFIYARRSKGSKHTEDYQWIVGKDNVLLKTGVCLTIERAQRNADFFLRKLKCRLLNHKHQAFA